MAKSKPKTPMPISERAKQFSPFSPLKGLEEALAQKAKVRVARRELCEDAAEVLNAILVRLQPGCVVTVYYYEPTEREYLQTTGTVTEIDRLCRMLWIGQTKIAFGDLYEITVASE